MLCVIDIYSKHEWVVPLNNKKDIAITKSFQKILDESGRKLDKTWIDKVSGFYNKSTKSWLQHDI